MPRSSAAGSTSAPAVDPPGRSDERLARQGERDAAGEEVGVDGEVGVGVADVAPVARRDLAEERLPFGQEPGEQVGGEVDRLVARHAGERPGGEDEDPCVHRIGKDLAPGRLLQEAEHPSPGVDDDDPELQRVGDPGQGDRRRRTAVAVERHEVGEVEVAHDVGRDRQALLGAELLDRAGDRAGAPEVAVGMDEAKPEPGRAGGGQRLADPRLLVEREDCRLVESGARPGGRGPGRRRGG